MFARSLLAAAGAAAVLSTVLVSPVLAQGPAGGAEASGLNGPTVYSNEPSSASLASRRSVELRDVPMVALGAINPAELLAQDRVAVRPGKVLRYGVVRDVDAPAPLEAMGRWFLLPSGEWLWALDVAGPNAAGLRLELETKGLPAGAQVAVSAGPAVAGQAPSGQAFDVPIAPTITGPAVWTPTVFAASGDAGAAPMAVVRLEVVLPAKIGADLAGVGAGPGLRINRVVHVYRDLSIDPANQAPQVGNCHNDVTCSPAWANTARASAGIGSVQGADALYCSATMINTQAGDFTPYILSANHCLSDQASASSLEVFWLYQTPTCNGTPPALSSVPRSSVATLVSTAASSDYTLLLLNGAVPTGLFWSGWTSNVIADGTNIAGVHHPDGSWKRISFATLGNTPTCGSPVSNFIRANWSSGVTEPGSSGSGLFRASDFALIGQLFCGPSACGVAAANLNDTYGEFAVTYTSIAGPLTVGSDDPAPTNNTCATAQARPATSTSSPGRILRINFPDFYSFTVPAGQTLTASITFTPAFGNIDLDARVTCAGSVVTSTSGANATKTLTYQNSTAAAQTVIVRAVLSSSVRNTYDLTTAVGGPVSTGNDLCVNATNIPAAGGTFTGSTQGAAANGQTACGSSNGSSDVYFRFVSPGNGTLTLNTCGSAFDTVLSVHSACPVTAANSIACNDDASAGPCSGSTASFLTVPVQAGTPYIIRVGGFQTAAGTYTLNASYAGTIPPANDLCANAQTVGNGAFAFDTSNAATDGPAETLCNNANDSQVNGDVWFRYIASCTGTATVTTCGSSFDTKLAAYNACPTQPNTAIACNDDSTVCGGSSLQSVITFNVVAQRNYLIRVGGFTTARGAGTLNITCAGAPTCTADYNGDGILNTDDLSDYITDYFTQPAAPGPGGFAQANVCTGAPAPYNAAGYRADVNGDCVVNTDDISDYITLYFNPPPGC